MRVLSHGTQLFRSINQRGMQINVQKNRVTFDRIFLFDFLVILNPLSSNPAVISALKSLFTHMIPLYDT